MEWPLWQTLTPGHVVWWWHPRLTITSEMVGEEGKRRKEGGREGGRECRKKGEKRASLESEEKEWREMEGDAKERGGENRGES